MIKVSYKVAFGGVISSICLLLMFMTLVFPVLALCLPIFSGMLIAVVAIEINIPWGFVTYAVVAALSIFVTPDISAAIFFILFFGYYPILKLAAEKKIKFFLLRLILKFAAFNIAIISSYYLIVNIFGLVDLFTEFEFIGEYLIAGLIIFANIVFILYDITLALLTTTYLKWFRPTFLQKIK